MLFEHAWLFPFPISASKTKILHRFFFLNEQKTKDPTFFINSKWFENPSSFPTHILQIDCSLREKFLFKSSKVPKQEKIKFCSCLFMLA